MADMGAAHRVPGLGASLPSDNVLFPPLLVLLRGNTAAAVSLAHKA